MEYLDFEFPLKQLEDQLEKCINIGDESKVDVTDTYKNEGGKPLGVGRDHALCIYFQIPVMPSRSEEKRKQANMITVAH